MKDKPASSRPYFPNVTVLLGDPRLADGSKREGAFHEEDFTTRDAMKEALATLPGYQFSYLDDHGAMIETLQRERPDFVLNFCDTGFRNSAYRELNPPAFLEMIDVPYSGATPAAMVLAWDKAIVRTVAASLGIPVPEETYIPPGGDIEALLPDRYPAFVKPSCADGSVGITRDAIVDGPEQAAARVRQVQAELPGRAILVQEFLSGAEYGVGIIGNLDQGLTVLPPLEVDYDSLDPEMPRLLGFESKAMPDSPYWTDIHYRAARLDAQKVADIERSARLMFERLSLRDYGRFDFRADSSGVIKLMEINPNPAWAYDAKLAMMAGFADIAYADMLRMILETAQTRAAAERGLV